MSSIDGYDVVRIVSAGGDVDAQFVPAANMLCASLRWRGTELLHDGHGVRAYAQEGKTMGIPLLHPWANRLSRAGYRAGGVEVGLPPAAGRYPTDPNGLPIHGALPGRLRWTVQDVYPERVQARLAWSDPDLLELFPFPHALQIDAHALPDGLRLTTILTPTGEETVPVCFGFHPYLRPPGDVPRGEWRVSLGARDRLVLDDRMIPTGASEPLAENDFVLAERSFDDGLAGLGQPATFTVSAGGATLAVVFDEGFDFAQVYAPPGQDFICFEPMTAPADALNSGEGLMLAAPGVEHRTAFSVRVSDN